MITRAWKPDKHRLEDAFFPVELCDLKFVFPSEKDLFGNVVRKDDMLVKGHKAVVDIEKCHVFATVTDNYRLVTNRQAYEWSEPVMSTVFRHSHLADFTCFNVRMTSTRSSCCIDLVRKLDGGNVIQFTPFGKDDPWTAFIRITNSYNKTSCLKYQLGFCRWICQNGVIFDSRSVDYVFVHTQDTISEEKLRFRLRKEAEERIGEIQTLEEEFIAKLRKLREHPIPANSVLALACKVFDQNMTRDRAKSLTEQQRKRAREFVAKIKYLTEEYYNQFGANAYAAMNVMTDFATYPKGIVAQGDISRLQAKAGLWLDEFVRESANAGFSLTKYLGEDAVESATWFESLTAA